jgi:hypothetical protein
LARLSQNVYKEASMSRVINPETAGKQRKLLMRGVVVAVRTLMQQQSQDELSRDLAAFIGLSLLEIYNTVNVSVAAWEKRDYWVKADRYRMEWLWSQQLGTQLCEAVLAEEWTVIAGVMAKVAQRVMSVDLPQRHRIGEPWIGAWEQLQDTYPPTAQ